MIQLSSRRKEQMRPLGCFRTQNIFNFLELDTRNGRVWQIQWSTDENNRIVWPINTTRLGTDSSAAKPGKFTLYPTANIFTFMLLDQRIWLYLAGSMEHEIGRTTDYADDGMVGYCLAGAGIRKAGCSAKTVGEARTKTRTTDGNEGGCRGEVKTGVSGCCHHESQMASGSGRLLVVATGIGPTRRWFSLPRCSNRRHRPANLRANSLSKPRARRRGISERFKHHLS